MELPVEHDAGIRVSMPFDLSAGAIVPEYHERLAAKFSLVPWPQWIKLPYVDKVRMVAFMRIYNSIDDHGRDSLRKM